MKMEVKYIDPPYSYQNWSMLKQLENDDNPFYVAVEMAISEELKRGKSNKKWGSLNQLERELHFRYRAAERLDRCVMIGLGNLGEDYIDIHIGVDVTLDKPDWSTCIDIIKPAVELVGGFEDFHTQLVFRNLGRDVAFNFCDHNHHFGKPHETRILGSLFYPDDLDPHPAFIDPHGYLVQLPYQEYLQSQHWQFKKTEALKHAFYRCQVCNVEGHINLGSELPTHYRDRQLHVHHRTYERKGHELPQDLIVLCDECHDLFHKNRKLAAHKSGVLS
jgi:hypothetical protein